METNGKRFSITAQWTLNESDIMTMPIDWCLNDGLPWYAGVFDDKAKNTEYIHAEFVADGWISYNAWNCL